MMLAAALLLSLLPPAQDEPLSVAALEQRHAEFTGRTILVQGKLAECQPLSCGLLGDRAVNDGAIMWLSFESAPAFDAAAAPLVGHRVVVEGVVLDQCWPDPAKRPPCTDRGSQFRPLKVVRVLD